MELLLVYRLFGTATCDMATESKQVHRLCDSHKATFKLVKHHLTQTPELAYEMCLMC